MINLYFKNISLISQQIKNYLIILFINYNLKSFSKALKIYVCVTLNPLKIKLRQKFQSLV